MGMPPLAKAVFPGLVFRQCRQFSLLGMSARAGIFSSPGMSPERAVRKI